MYVLLQKLNGCWVELGRGTQFELLELIRGSGKFWSHVIRDEPGESPRVKVA